MEMNLFVWFAPRTMWEEASPFIRSTFARLTHAPRGGECVHKQGSAKRLYSHREPERTMRRACVFKKKKSKL